MRGLGALNRLVKIQQKTDGKDTGGHPIATWSDYCTIFASRQPLKGHEFFSALAVQAEKTVRYRIRYRTGITSEMRLIDEGRIYSIYAVLDDVHGDRQLTDIMVKEFTNG